ncbi:MAG: hypothetical protein ACRD43_06870, partial [Pyrinomonadaceae bacterium]
TVSDGLNPDVARPTQLYYVPLPPATTTFSRITKFPSPSTFLASSQPITTNSRSRLVFNLALTELGTGNQDLQSEGFYLLEPVITAQGTANVSFVTGATALPIAPSVSPSPSPTQQPPPTPTPTPSPSPTPVTPAQVTGISPGMLAILSFDTAQPITSRTAVGSFARRFNLPIELSGLSMSINGIACGLKSVSSTQIVFVVPPFLSSAIAGTVYDLVINNSGTVTRGKVTIVPTRPDIFNSAGVIGPGGRAKLFNITNRVFLTEPFTVTTIKIKGGVRVPSVMRLYATGVANADPATISIRIGSVTMVARAVAPGTEPGIYFVDFALLPGLNAAGDQPVVLSVNVNGTIFNSRVDDTTSFVRIL